MSKRITNNADMTFITLLFFNNVIARTKTGIK